MDDTTDPAVPPSDESTAVAAADAPAGIASDAEADAARAEGLRACNAGDHEAALTIFERVLRHRVDQHGELDAACGVAYLDYGQSLLGLLQGADAATAALGHRDEEDMEACFLNLDAARVSLEKAQRADPADVRVGLMLAEAHEALSHVFLEQDRSTDALRELEAARLVLNRAAEVDPTDARIRRRRVAALYSSARCHLSEGDLSGARDLLAAAVDDARSGGANVFPPDALAELQQVFDETEEQRREGGIEAVRDAIGELFPREAERAVYEAECSADDTPPTLLRPLDEEHSRPLALAALPAGEDSCSRSLFPPQSSQGGETSVPISDRQYEAPVVKKPKGDLKRERET